MKWVCCFFGAVLAVLGAANAADGDAAGTIFCLFGSYVNLKVGEYI